MTKMSPSDKRPQPGPYQVIFTVKNEDRHEERAWYGDADCPSDATQKATEGLPPSVIIVRLVILFLGIAGLCAFVARFIH